jgi:hypothetical protein
MLELSDAHAEESMLDMLNNILKDGIMNEQMVNGSIVMQMIKNRLILNSKIKI